MGGTLSSWIERHSAQHSQVFEGSILAEDGASIRLRSNLFPRAMPTQRLLTLAQEVVRWLGLELCSMGADVLETVGVEPLQRVSPHPSPQWGGVLNQEPSLFAMVPLQSASLLTPPTS